MDLLGGGPTQPEPTPAPVQPPAPASSSGGDLLDLLGGLDLGSTNAGWFNRKRCGLKAPFDWLSSNQYLK